MDDRTTKTFNERASKRQNIKDRYRDRKNFMEKKKERKRMNDRMKEKRRGLPRHPNCGLRCLLSQRLLRQKQTYQTRAIELWKASKV